MTDYAGKETDLNSTDLSLFIVTEGGGKGSEGLSCVTVKLT